MSDYRIEKKIIEPKTMVLAAEMIWTSRMEVERRLREDLMWQRLPIELLIAFGRELKEGSA